MKIEKSAMAGTLDCTLKARVECAVQRFFY